MTQCAFGQIAENKGDNKNAEKLRAEHYWASKRIGELEKENAQLRQKIESLSVII